VTFDNQLLIQENVEQIFWNQYQRKKTQ